jgi:hypothetical protein
MKLNDINPLISPQVALFVDLDGVQVDFSKFCEDKFGIRPEDADKDKATKREFWKRVKKWSEAGNPLFSAMDPMPDAFVLWDYIKKYNPIVLSATGTATKGAASEKREWVSKHLGESYAKSAIFVTSGKEKAMYATPTSILVDDRAVAIDPWVAAGGIGILHTSASSTIAKLKELGL